MENISYGKIVLIGAGHVGSAILDSLLRMNLADEIVVINRNEKKALGVVLDASHTTAFAYISALKGRKLFLKILLI